MVDRVSVVIDMLPVTTNICCVCVHRHERAGVCVVWYEGPSTLALFGEGLIVRHTLLRHQCCSIASGKGGEHCLGQGRELRRGGEPFCVAKQGFIQRVGGGALKFSLPSLNFPPLEILKTSMVSLLSMDIKFDAC